MQGSKGSSIPGNWLKFAKSASRAVPKFRSDQVAGAANGNFVRVAVIHPGGNQCQLSVTDSFEMPGILRSEIALVPRPFIIDLK